MSNIKFENDVRQVLLEGTQLMYNAVSITMGAKGRNVIIKDGFNGMPQITKDGVTVAKKVSSEDLMADGAVSLLRSAAEKTNETVGDGTTSTIVLAHSLFEASNEVLNEKWYKSTVNSIMFKKGIDRALEEVTKELDKMARMDFDTYDVASISANGDNEMAKLISEAFKKVGKDGMVGFESSPTSESFITRDEGLKIDNGYVTDYFVTDLQKRIAQYKESLILIVDAEIENMNDIVYYAMAAEQANKPLIVIAHKFGQEVINSFAKSKVEKGFRTILVQAPFYGDKRSNTLKDIAVMAKTDVLSERMGTLTRLGIKGSEQKHRVMSASKKLGSISKIVSSKDSTSIYYTINKEYIKELKEAYDELGDESFRERIAMLTGGVATINVGGNSETEVNERLDRVEDAVNATRVSLKNGVVAGGGIALLKAREVIKELKFLTSDEKKGADTLYKVMESPARRILENAELTFKVYGEYPNWIDVRTNNRVNFFEVGVVDPLNVVKVSLKNAVSVASTLSTSGAYVLIVR